MRTLAAPATQPAVRRLAPPRVRWWLVAAVLLAWLGGNFEPPPTPLERGDVFYAQGRLAEAALAYQKALRTPPESPLPAARLGHVYEERRLYDRAEGAYLEARRLAPRDPDRWLDLGRLYAKLADEPRALSALAEARRLAPNDPRVPAELIDAYLATGRLADARRALNEWLTAAPADRAANLRLGELLAPTEPGPARSQLNYVVRMGPDDALAREAQAVRAELDRLSDEPEAAFRAAQIGDFFSRSGQTGLAASAFEAATGLRPDYPEAWARLGLARLQMDDPGGADEAFEAALRLAPDLPLAHYGRAQLLRRQSDLPGAIRALERAGRSADDPAINGRIAELYAQLGDYERGIALLQQTYNQTRSAEAAAALARFYLGHALDSAEAVRWARVAQAAAPDDPDVLTVLGWALASDRQALEAEATLRAVLLRQPQSAEAHFRLGQALELQGRLNEAAEAYARAFDLDAAGILAGRALAALEAVRGAR